ncbi:glycosyltransferase family 4 protein, partial [Candidatus Woesearchaeota archaeon]|nr:glycosyltransferase family 4 protein [Candidatus Woesearchaeota archaeon]
MIKNRLAVLMSHPIQYQVPLLRKLAAHPQIDLMIYFFWDFGVRLTMDPEFKKEIQWDIPILEGYSHAFVKNYAPHPSSSFFGQLGFGIIGELIRKRYDAVLIYGWNSFPNWCALFIAPLIGTKIILAGESPYSQEIQKKYWVRAIKHIVLGFVFGVVNAIMYIGEENRKFYELYKVPKNKLFFMPYSVENERLIRVMRELHPRRNEIRKKWSIDTDECVVLFVGKLFEKKRPMDLLRAFEIVSQKTKKKSTLLFVGDGEQRAELEAHAKEKNLRVHFAGFKNQTELPEYYVASDVFVLPSGAGETWGLVVNEAMVFGLPVIVSDVVGCGVDLVHEKENGYIVPLGNMQLLAERILLLIESEEIRKKFGAVSQ